MKDNTNKEYKVSIFYNEIDGHWKLRRGNKFKYSLPASLPGQKGWTREAFVKKMLQTFAQDPVMHKGWVITNPDEVFTMKAPGKEPNREVQMRYVKIPPVVNAVTDMGKLATDSKMSFNRVALDEAVNKSTSYRKSNTALNQKLEKVNEDTGEIKELGRDIDVVKDAMDLTTDTAGQPIRVNTFVNRQNGTPRVTRTVEEPVSVDVNQSEETINNSQNSEEMKNNETEQDVQATVIGSVDEGRIRYAVKNLATYSVIGLGHAVGSSSQLGADLLQAIANKSYAKEYDALVALGRPPGTVLPTGEAILFTKAEFALIRMNGIRVLENKVGDIITYPFEYVGNIISSLRSKAPAQSLEPVIA